MKRSISIFLSGILAALLAVMASAILAGCASAGSIDALTVDVTPGTQMQRGFVNDNVLHTSDGMDIHFSLYVPASYDGSEAYALFVTLPGWGGLYFQGVGANMEEDFGTEAIRYNSRMIVVSPQLNDWGQTSAEQTIALTEYFLSHYNIDPDQVYLHGMSGGGETASLVMGMRPELYAACLLTSTQWDGDLNALAAAHTPIYFAIGAQDSYYGPESLQRTYRQLCSLYAAQGVSQAEIDQLVVLDLREQDYFSSYGFSDQHAGGQAFAHDADVMSWLFSHRND